MAKSPDRKIDFLSPDPWAEGGILRPKDWNPNPYIGKDGQDYHSWEALQEADRRFRAGLFMKIPFKIV